MNNELFEYLEETLKTFDVDEEEKLVLLEYIREISTSFQSLYRAIDDDSSKDIFLTELEKQFTKEK